MKRNYMANNWSRWIGAAYLTVMFVVPVVMSCSKPPPFNSMSEYEQFQYIKECIRKNKLTTGKQWLNQFLVVHPASAVRDSVRYLLGETYYRLSQYILAANEFDRLVAELPNSPLADDAAYKRSMCYYKMSPGFHRDQEYTYKAILYFQRMLEDFPDTEYLDEVNEKMQEMRGKLARKRYETGRLYHKMSDYRAAVLTYSQVLKEFYDSKWAPLALKGKGECHMELKEFGDAKESFQDFLTRYPKHEDVPAVKSALARAERNLPAAGITEKSSR